MSTLVVYVPLMLLELALRHSEHDAKAPDWWKQFFLLNILRLLTLTGVYLALTAIFARPIGYATYLIPLRAFWHASPLYFSATCAFFLYTGIHYWNHRIRHTNDFLWLASHQMHHFPQRFDLSLSLYSHPLDVLINQLGYVPLILCGFGFRECILIGGVQNVLDRIQHLRIVTPPRLGYFIYRPEQHSYHHLSHDNNYGLIPVWDILFGTFHDGREFASKVGLSDTNQRQFWRILFFRRAQ